MVWSVSLAWDSEAVELTLGDCLHLPVCGPQPYRFGSNYYGCSRTNAWKCSSFPQHRLPAFWVKLVQCKICTIFTIHAYKTFSAYFVYSKTYLVQSVNQCWSCHQSNSANTYIGPTAWSSSLFPEPNAFSTNVSHRERENFVVSCFKTERLNYRICHYIKICQIYKICMFLYYLPACSLRTRICPFGRCIWMHRPACWAA